MIKIKACPKCKSTAIIKLPSGETEVFECTNCKFKGTKFNEIEEQKTEKIEENKKRKK